MSDRTPPAYLETLAQFAVNTGFGDLSVTARDRARWIIADCIPVVAAGMQQPEMKALVAKQLAGATPGNCWVMGAGKRTNPFDAALLNGTAGTWLELDEGNLFSRGHPGIQVVPAATALAQDLDAPGKELLLAVALGYEVSSRINRACEMHLAVHPHGTYGVIGAAVAAGRLKGFDAAQMREVINCASTMGMATSRHTLLDGATVRNIFTGHSGYMGLTASRLVECGFTGEINGVANVYGKIYSDGFDPAKAISGLGSEWVVAKNYFKLHPTGRYVHSAIDALEDLLSKVPGGRLKLDDILRIEVKTYMLCAMLAEKSVVSSFGSRFSVPFALASILYHGRSGLSSFDDAAVANPKIQALAKLVDLREDTSYTARYPNEQICDLTITLKSGQAFAGRCSIMKGEPSNPHKPEELRGKFFDLGTPIWGGDTTEKLFDGMMKIESIPSFRAFADGFAL